MIKCGFEFAFPVVSAIAVTSLKGNASGVICDGEIILLFTYIADRGRVSLGAVAIGSISVHAWCIGDDFVRVESQNCSCSINIAYRVISGSLRMP
jgi:hypothetical protein